MAIFARLPTPALSVNRLTWLLILMPTVASVLQYTVYAQFNSLVAFALTLTYYGLCWQKYLLAGLSAGAMLLKPQVALLTILALLIWSGLTIVLIGSVFVILFHGYARLYPTHTRWLWWSIVGFFVVGLVAFVTTLLVSGLNGLHIVAAESVYRFTLPVFLGLVALPLILTSSVEPV